jgi:hypothetical protein
LPLDADQLGGVGLISTAEWRQGDSEDRSPPGSFEQELALVPTSDDLLYEAASNHSAAIGLILRPRGRAIRRLSGTRAESVNHARHERPLPISRRGVCGSGLRGKKLGTAWSRDVSGSVIESRDLGCWLAGRLKCRAKERMTGLR